MFSGGGSVWQSSLLRIRLAGGICFGAILAQFVKTANARCTVDDLHRDMPDVWGFSASTYERGGSIYNSRTRRVLRLGQVRRG